MPLLLADDVTVRFGGITALSDASVDVEEGSITGLIGPNGAGKTTLFNAICGLNEPASGRITFDGRNLGGLPPYRRIRLGMARTFQRLEVFGSLTVLENVLVALEIRKSWSDEEDTGDPKAAAAEFVELVGLGDIASERVDAVSTGHARLVEVARALATKPKLLLLDEPSAGLDESESDAFGDLLLRLPEGGLSILLVEHDVELVMRVCDRIHVLDFGRIIARGTPKEIRGDPGVQAAYLGAEAEVAS